MDLSGHGNAGQLNGNPDWYGNGLYFDGSGDSVNLQDKLIPASDDFTLTGMIKVDNVSTWRTIFSQFTSGQSGRFIFEVNRYTRELLVYIGSSLYSGLFLNLGQTYNVVLVRQNNVFKFYLDGVKGTDRANSISIYQGENTFIGDTTGGYDFHGGVYGASIFLEALSHRQIKFLNDNPYFMYQIPEELYGWTGGAAPTGNPYWYYKMLKERN
ncbi:MAG: LamG-like jellyroll fold domain-containing protein [Methanosarcinaceae archaeon]